jgi:hypothetical protein
VNRSALMNNISCCETAWTYLQVLLELSIYLTELSKMVMLRNVEVISTQTLNYSV